MTPERAAQLILETLQALTLATETTLVSRLSNNVGDAFCEPATTRQALSNLMNTRQVCLLGVSRPDEDAVWFYFLADCVFTHE